MNNLTFMGSFIGLSCAISITGTITDNSQLTTVGNVGTFSSFVAYASQVKKERQQNACQINTNFIELKQQVNTLKETVEREQAQNKSLQQSFSFLEGKQNQNLESISNVIDRLQTDFYQVDNLLTEQGQQFANVRSQQQQIGREVNYVKLQLKNHSKKLLKQKSSFNSQQANQNHILSRVQKLENKLQQLADKESKKQIARQVKTSKEIAKSAKNKVKFPVVKTSIVSREPQNYCYIDNNNLYKCLDNEGIQIDYATLLVMLTKEGKNQINLYDGAFPNQEHRYKQLRKMGYQATTLPIVSRGKGKFKTVGDDVQLAIDLVCDVQSGDRAILVSGDGDLFPAVKKVKEKGDVTVTVIAKSTAVSKELLAHADEFISLESIMYDIAQHTKLSA